MTVVTTFEGMKPQVDRLKFRSMEKLEAWVVDQLVEAKASAIVRREGHQIECFNINTGRKFAVYEQVE